MEKEDGREALWKLSLYIYFASLSVYLFVSYKRQNSYTDRALILFGTSYDTMVQERFMDDQSVQN